MRYYIFHPLPFHHQEVPTMLEELVEFYLAIGHGFRENEHRDSLYEPSPMPFHVFTGYCVGSATYLYVEPLIRLWERSTE